MIFRRSIKQKLILIALAFSLNLPANAAAEEAISNRSLRQDSQSADPRVRYEAVVAMVSQGPLLNEDINLLLDRADDEEIAIRVQVARGLGKLFKQDDIIVQALLKLLNDKEEVVRIEAIQSLGRLSITDPVALHQLTAVLKAGSKQEKISALSALSNYGRAAQIVSSEISPMLSDKDWLVRSFAIDTMLEIGGEEAQEAITNSVKTADNEMLFGAADSFAAYSNRSGQLIILFEFIKRHFFVLLFFSVLLTLFLRWLIAKGIMTFR